MLSFVLGVCSAGSATLHRELTGCKQMAQTVSAADLERDLAPGSLRCEHGIHLRPAPRRALIGRIPESGHRSHPAPAPARRASAADDAG